MGLRSEVWEGGCSCGEIRFVARGAATHLTWCHCHSCRLAASTTPVPWGTFRDGFEYTRGTPSREESSPGITREACSGCRSALTYQCRDDEIDVVLTSLDAGKTLTPTDHTWTSDADPGAVPNDGLPHYPRTREEGSEPRDR